MCYGALYAADLSFHAAGWGYGLGLGYGLGYAGWGLGLGLGLGYAGCKYSSMFISHIFQLVSNCFFSEKRRFVVNPLS